MYDENFADEPDDDLKDCSAIESLIEEKDCLKYEINRMVAFLKERNFLADYEYWRDLPF